MATFEFLQNVFSGLLTNAVIAIIIILIGFIVGRIVGKLVQGILHELELNTILGKAGIKTSIEELIGTITSYFIYFVAVIMALNQIGITSVVLNILAGGAVVLIIISLVLAVKDYIPNLFAGIFIHQKRFIRNGDWIKVKNVEGKVTHINLVETRIETKNKDIIYVPNSFLTKNEVVKVRKGKKS